MDIYYDYHVHTNFSSDGEEAIAAMCQAAIQRGLREICFTEHVDLIPWDKMCGYFRPGDFMAELERCRVEFAGQLSIRAGVEVSEPHLVAREVEALLAAWPFDFVLGSAHWIDQSGIYLSEIYEGRQPDYVEREYLLRVLELAEEGDFDCLGHLDLIRRYRPAQLGPFDTLAYADIIRAILGVVIQRDKAIEINTSPLRQGRAETCPDLIIVQWYRELGGEKLTIGSDAHYPADVAAGLNVAVDMARAAGFTRLVRFECRRPEWIPL